jgi:hypothetical protein
MKPNFLLCVKKVKTISERNHFLKVSVKSLFLLPDKNFSLVRSDCRRNPRALFVAEGLVDDWSVHEGRLAVGIGGSLEIISIKHLFISGTMIEITRLLTLALINMDW